MLFSWWQLALNTVIYVILQKSGLTSETMLKYLHAHKILASTRYSTSGLSLVDLAETRSGSISLQSILIVWFGYETNS